MPQYKLHKMSGDRAILILNDLLKSLSDIDEDLMTTFELNILHRCAENPPSRQYGCEAE